MKSQRLNIPGLVAAYLVTAASSNVALAAPDARPRAAPLSPMHKPVGSPRSIELNEQGVVAIKAKNSKQAEDLFRQALAADAGNLSAVFNLAGALLVNKKENEAIALLTEYTKNFGLDPGLFVRLGDVYFTAKKLIEAAEAYEKALHIAPNYPGIAPKLGAIYTLLNRSTQAERAFLLAVEQNPKDGQSLSNLAGIFLANGKPDKAISTAKRALQVRPGSELYVTLGTAYEIQKDYKNALIAFQRAVDLGDKREELKKKIEALKQAAS
jgi:tetratricopeptide (TPR) repeat protein